MKRIKSKLATAFLVFLLCIPGIAAINATLVYFENAGDTLVVESGGDIKVKSGGTLDVQSGANVTLKGLEIGLINYTVDKDDVNSETFAAVIPFAGLDANDKVHVDAHNTYDPTNGVGATRYVTSVSGVDTLTVYFNQVPAADIPLTILSGKD